MIKNLMFQHDCLPKVDGQIGCPMAGMETAVMIEMDSQTPGLYVMPDARCAFTNNKLKLMAIDYNRDI